MRDLDSRPLPLDQADGLRRLFARQRVKMIPVVCNPHIAFGGVMLERLCTGFTELGLHVLVVDASERAGAPSELALMDLADAIEPLSQGVSYLAARGLAIRHVDATGSTAPFLAALADAAPRAEVILVHAPATELARLFARGAELARRSGDEAALVRPLLLADDRPASVTHAYAALKLLTQRAGLVVHELMLAAAPGSPRAERIAMQLATCADDFLGAVLRDWVRVDPATDAAEPPDEALRRWVRETLHPDAAQALAMAAHGAGRPPQRAQANRAMNR
ncbi:flagellar biosynthesis protein [Piscinibacter sp.]|uniref:flagellar biosynthesis protein n=1 Tax=Piscinibacter sp. TaxID=1903157 RepID=UPI0039E379C0